MDHVTYRTTVSAEVSVARRFVDALGRAEADSVASGMLRDTLRDKIERGGFVVESNVESGHKVIVRDACGIEMEMSIPDSVFAGRRLFMPVKRPLRVVLDPPAEVEGGLATREFEYRGVLRDGVRVLEEVLP